MTYTAKQVITIHILTKIPITKGYQTMKIGQLIKYNMRNILFEKPYAKYGGKTSPQPFSKKSKLNISLDQQTEILCSIFFLYA